MRILFVGAEITPLVSTGGLAEVAAALPRALRAQGHDARVALPCFRQIPEVFRGEPAGLCSADFGGRKLFGALRRSVLPVSEIPVWLLEHQGFFGRDALYGAGAYEYDDNAERFCFFCLALLDGIQHSGWRPDVIHCHDWHAASLPIYLKTMLRDDLFWSGIPIVFTIHNLAYQGRYRPERFAGCISAEAAARADLSYEGDYSLMKGALNLADALTTVSPRYAQEIQTLDYGCGLHDTLRSRRSDLFGILNGVDYSVWSPAADPMIAANYTAADLTGKQACKQALQTAFDLPHSDAPVFGIVSRLHWQKGVDMIVDAVDRLMAYDLQLVVLGRGDPEVEHRLRAAAAAYPAKIGARLDFDAACAHQVQAGSDFFLMPSRYEPCGLSQLYAMAYGTVPIVRRTGGLADTVQDFRPGRPGADEATGISFVPRTWQALARAVEKALSLYQERRVLRRLQHNGLKADYSWERSSREYTALYERVLRRFRHVEQGRTCHHA